MQKSTDSVQASRISCIRAQSDTIVRQRKRKKIHVEKLISFMQITAPMQKKSNQFMFKENKKRPIC